MRDSNTFVNWSSSKVILIMVLHARVHRLEMYAAGNP